MKHTTRKLMDGAMMCAIVGLILLIDRQTGQLLESLFLFAFPIPMVFFASKYGMKDSWVVWAAMVLLCWIIGTIPMIFMVGGEAFIGMVYGAGIYKKKPTHQTLLLTMVLSALIQVATTVIFASFFGYDLNADIAAFQQALEQMQQQTGITLMVGDIGSFLKTLFVVVAVVTGVLLAYLTHFFSRLLLKRLQVPLPAATPLYAYMPPIWTGYVALAGMVGYYYSVYKPLDSAVWQPILQGFGMCGYLYLIAFGAIALVCMSVLYRSRMKGLMVFASIFLMLFASLPAAIIGFLYITTGVHKKALEGFLHASENGQG